VSHGSVHAKIGGEGWGEGAVSARCVLRKPPHPTYRPPSPSEGEKGLIIQAEAIPDEQTQEQDRAMERIASLGHL
jgi:hypothetical protein